jgi:uncharacterized protein YkwD
MKKIILILLITITLLATLACTDISILSGINQTRLNNGLNQLVEKQELNDFVNYRLSKMTYPPNHNNLKADYETFSNINNLKHVKFVGEIIFGSDYIFDKNDILNIWLNSPSHKNVILNKQFVNFGYAERYLDETYKCIIVIFTSN